MFIKTILDGERYAELKKIAEENIQWNKFFIFLKNHKL